MYAGVDGEAADLDPPLRFATRAAALRVRMSLRHPGASPSARLRLPGRLPQSQEGRGLGEQDSTETRSNGNSFSTAAALSAFERFLQLAGDFVGRGLHDPVHHLGGLGQRLVEPEAWRRSAGFTI